MNFEKSTLKNGIRVISEKHSQSHAVALAVWVNHGTRDEPKGLGGVSHFLEHMVFKGTKKRSAYQIAKSLEALGGELNAYTTREYTCYHALVLKNHWRQALDVLSDLVSNMKIKQDDFELEQSVVLQEIAMSEDNIEDLIYDVYLENTLSNEDLGRPILGTAHSVSHFKRKQIVDFYKESYSGKNILVSCAGDVDHYELYKEVEIKLGHKTKGRWKLHRQKPKPKTQQIFQSKPGEQLHLLMGLPVSSFKDDYRFEAFVVNALLGGGMTSKLYQRIREKRGLAYSVYSSLHTFTDFGFLSIYAACDPKNTKTVFQQINAEIQSLKKKNITQHDLDLFKTQIKGAILLGSDDVENRMTSIAVNEMVFEKYKSVQDVILEIDSVTSKSVREFVNKYLDQDWSVVMMGAGAEEINL